MAGLDDHLQGVQPESLPGEVDDNLEPNTDDEVLDSNESLDADSEGAAADGDGEGEGDKGRTNENIYREVSRKLEKQQADNAAFQERILNKFAEIAENIAKPAEPDNTNGDDLSRRSVAELKTLRAQVPEDKKEAFEEYIVERMVQERVEASMTVSEQTRNAGDTRKQSTQAAVNMYPDLVKGESEFAREVDNELRLRGKTYAENNPHALMDVANAVALRQGVRQRTNPRIPGGGRTANKGNSAPANQKSDELSQSRERANAIADRLQGALPKGKKFNIDKMRKTTEEYTKNADLFIR